MNQKPYGKSTPETVATGPKAVRQSKRWTLGATRTLLLKLITYHSTLSQDGKLVQINTTNYCEIFKYKFWN